MDKHKTSHQVLKTPPYGNSSVQNPQGEVLFRCEEKRARWYLNRQLADVVQQDPLVVRLRFEPAGPGCKDDPYFTQTRENHCVGCGSSQNLTKHHVVPHGYRKFFPITLKSRAGEDILPLCMDCHHLYEEAADALKRQLVEELQLVPDKQALVLDRERRRIRGYAFTLKNHGHQLPDSRREHMLQALRDMYPSEPDGALIARGLQESYMFTRAGHVPLEQLVVQKTPDLFQFVVRWRKHFLQVLQPQFMPPHWNPERPLRKVRS